MNSGINKDGLPNESARPATSRLRRGGFAARIFPQRQLIFRTDGYVRCVNFTPRGQLSLTLVALALVGWFSYSVFAKLQFDRAMVAKEREISALTAAKDNEIQSLNLAYGDLKSVLTKSESRFGTLARTLEAKHAYLMALLDRQANSAETLKSGLADRPDADPTRARIASSRQALLFQLGALELVLQRNPRPDGDGLDEGGVVKNNVPIDDSDLARMIRERKRLITRIKKLEQRLHAVNKSQRGVMNYFAARSINDFARAKKLVAISGVDVDGLLNKIDIASLKAQGGPFVAALQGRENKAFVPPALEAIDHQLDRWEKLGLLIGRLPLIAPTGHYFVASGFGKRRDPINRRWAMHYGLDLAGIYRSPVLATAPGIVVKTGWSGSYGRMVEIDHGLGIRTRYGHLRRILVKRGQKVGLRHKIGQMGSSGRSTGTHIHYEISLNGEPHNPQKFLQAGRYVLKGY